ncbi:dipeptide/oligopeptide/nickel ABC transporter permease/ATP-binding protein [Zhihengliuella halotolerans]|uniref:dipeptide/oligopeptide/nickel ABC transporter permease/ATP-binding protein n=1 Tax=Zhihengliuella halotolerans TaxID=370736 RepID=UPI000C7FDADF|nr:dipeptide/oligopeptide/nickel ABC transporter permease/ATP-binding protein [Zhihengliuella halotolerans]
MSASSPGLLRRLAKHPTGAPSLAFLLLIAVVAVTSRWLMPHDPTATSVSLVMSPPSAEYWLGGDGAGRDVFSRLLIATTFSVAGGLVVAVVAALLGVTGGLVAGYFGGWIDAAGAWLTALLMSAPAMVILLAARTAFGPSLWFSMLIFGTIIAPAYYRVVYNAVRGVRSELYVDAARTSGLSTPRIIARHILLAVRAPVILMTAGIIAAGIGMMAALDFLGLGSPATPTWGQMLSEAFYEMTRNPLLVLWPSLALGLTMIALVLFGAALRDELEGTTDVPSARVVGAWSPTAAAPPAPAVVHEDDDDRAALLSVEGLAVAYPGAHGWTTVVHDSNLTIRTGQIHGLIGESGSGKSQTAFAVLGLLAEGGRAVAGSIVFDGVDLLSLSDAEMNARRGRRIAYVPQEPMSNLDPAFTVGSQMTEPLCTVLGVSAQEAKRRSLELLGRVGIPDPERTFSSYPHQLSGGMAQRVLIAAAVASGPDLLIADEPTTALDVTVQAEVLDLLREFRDEAGMSILIVTHSLGVVADLCDHVSVMERGAIVESGPVESVFAAPRHAYTRKLFAAIPTGEPRPELEGSR